MRGRALVSVFRFGLIRGKLLTSKPKALHHLLAEVDHPLQGDKHETNLLLEEVHSICINIKVVMFTLVTHWGEIP